MSCVCNPLISVRVGLPHLATELREEYVDGEILYHAEANVDFPPASYSATVKPHHWKKFWRRLASISATDDNLVEIPEAEVLLNPDGESEVRRQLLSTNDSVSGVYVRHNASGLVLGTQRDVSVVRDHSGALTITAPAGVFIDSLNFVINGQQFNPATTTSTVTSTITSIDYVTWLAGGVARLNTRGMYGSYVVAILLHVEAWIRFTNVAHPRLAAVEAHTSSTLHVPIVLF